MTTHEFAGSLYRTVAEMSDAAVLAWIGADGRNDVAAELRSEPSDAAIVDEMLQSWEMGDADRSELLAAVARLRSQATAPVVVLGLGSQMWDTDAPQWERYGTVSVQIGRNTYQVGCVIGVPEHLRGTAEAAGGDTITPYLSAWYADASDWSEAGVPEYRVDDVLAAIDDAARRLWEV